MTAILEQVTCQIPDLSEVRGYEVALDGLTMPETVVALRATSWLQQEVLGEQDRELVKGTAEALAHNVREISKHACAVAARPDYTDIAVPEHPFFFDYSENTVDFSAASTCMFPDDEAPTVVVPQQRSMRDYAETKMLFLGDSGRQVERAESSASADEDASIEMPAVPNAPEGSSKARSGSPEVATTEAKAEISRELLAETSEATLIVLDEAQQRIVRRALKRLIQDDGDITPYDRALARAAMEIPALSGTLVERKTATQKIRQMAGRVLAFLTAYGDSHPAMKQPSLLQ